MLTAARFIKLLEWWEKSPERTVQLKLEYGVFDKKPKVSISLCEAGESLNFAFITPDQIDDIDNAFNQAVLRLAQAEFESSKKLLERLQNATLS